MLIKSACLLTGVTSYLVYTPYAHAVAYLGFHKGGGTHPSLIFPSSYPPSIPSLPSRGPLPPNTARGPGRALKLPQRVRPPDGFWCILDWKERFLWPCATFAVLKRESSSLKNHGGPAKGASHKAPWIRHCAHAAFSSAVHTSSKDKA